MRLRTPLLILILLALLLTPTLTASAEDAAEPCRKVVRPKVEVVFVLDTTGSMQSLIDGAKVKIWAIVNQIVSGKPVPDVRVGIVAYRDRGDDYITRFTGLTSDLDAIYGVLNGLAANGGGDGPESVNEALHVALTKTEWTRDRHTLRIMYLVGDAPPHMDYAQDVRYPKTCEAAARAGVIINTVQCGSMGGTRKVWKDIASRAEGRYFQIAQSGGMTRVDTPYDKRLAELSAKLSAGTLFYGARDARLRARTRLADAEKELDEAPDEARAERAGFLAKSGRVGTRDLLGLLERGELTLDKLEDKHLPEAIRKMEPEARKAHLTKLLEGRRELRAELIALDKKRGEFVKKARAKAGKKDDGFGGKVVEALRIQARKVGIVYDDR